MCGTRRVIAFYLSSTSDIVMIDFNVNNKFIMWLSTQNSRSGYRGGIQRIEMLIMVVNAHIYHRSFDVCFFRRIKCVLFSTGSTTQQRRHLCQNIFSIVKSFFSYLAANNIYHRRKCLKLQSSDKYSIFM